MASGITYVCTNCKKTIEAWSDGSPYYFDDKGKKQYAFHPDPAFELCTGNELAQFCLSCGEEFTVDSKYMTTACPKCESHDTVDTFCLGGFQCPFCRSGKFEHDPRCDAIS